MNVVEDIIEAITPTRREYKPRGAFGLDYVTRDEYATPDGRGRIEKNGNGWDAMRDDRCIGPVSMKDAARFARKG